MRVYGHKYSSRSFGIFCFSVSIFQHVSAVCHSFYVFFIVVALLQLSSNLLCFAIPTQGEAFIQGHFNVADIMRFFAVAALLAAFFTLLFAKPIAFTDDEIQRRWSLGESEVCCPSNAPGCYVLEWFRSLAGRVCLPVRLFTRVQSPFLLSQHQPLTNLCE